MAEGWTYVLCHQDFRYELKDGEQTVGRSRTSDVAVNDPSVSRKHVILKPKDGIVLLTDLGSSNGTFVNGKKVQGEAVLEDGDVLRLGDAELRVEIVHADAMQTVRMPLGGPSPRPQPGEATFFLAAESMKLAEALEAAQANAAPAPPGSHMPGPLSTQRLQLDPPPAAPAAAPSHETQRLPPGFVPPAAPAGAMETQRISTSAAPPAAAGSSLGTQRIEIPPAGPPPPAAPAAGTPAGAQTIRLTAAELRQLESPAETAPAPIPFEPEPISFEPEPISFEAPAAAYPSFEAPPAFEPWTPATAPETSFADIADPSNPATPRPQFDRGAYNPPAAAPPAFTPPPAPAPPAFTAPAAPPAFAPPPPAPPAFAPPPAPPAFAPPPPAFTAPAAPPPAAAGPPAFAPPAAAPPAFAAPPAYTPPPSFDRPTAPAAPPPAMPPMPAELRGLRQPSSAGELLPSLDDLDAAIGAPGIQDPLSQRGGTAQIPAGVPFGAPCAGFGIRLLAYLLDALWIGGLQTAAWIFSNGDPLFTSAASLVSLAVVFIGWSIWGTTPGKRVVGLYLHGEDGQTGIGFLRAFIRMVGYMISFALLGIGFLMILFTKDHRALHDRIARTWVYRHTS